MKHLGNPERDQRNHNVRDLYPAKIGTKSQRELLEPDVGKQKGKHNSPDCRAHGTPGQREYRQHDHQCGKQEAHGYVPAQELRVGSREQQDPKHDGKYGEQSDEHDQDFCERDQVVHLGNFSASRF